MEIKRYTNKFYQVTTSKYVLRVSDKREETPKTDVMLSISGAFKEEVTMTREQAVELRDSLSKAIRNMPKKAINHE